MTEDSRTPIRAIGGAPGGAGTAAGWFVVAQFSDGVLDVFTQSSSHRFHAAFISRVEVAEHPSPCGQQLLVQAEAQGCMIPTRFSEDQRAEVDAIADAVRQYRATLGLS
ncbi:hypothetical protein LH407_03785 [Antiquaquibacter oligotrophicus]|nr:hypothetical protein [Antiquaquibacter oligotrophicus]UDF13987.1 hypothetical protein LH407_03785 [Antiquaquibacter oligotrophicus]